MILQLDIIPFYSDIIYYTDYNSLRSSFYRNYSFHIYHCKSLPTAIIEQIRLHRGITRTKVLNVIGNLFRNEVPKNRNRRYSGYTCLRNNSIETYGWWYLWKPYGYLCMQTFGVYSHLGVYLKSHVWSSLYPHAKNILRDMYTPWSSIRFY